MGKARVAERPKTEIDVEKLMTWAYRDQLVDQIVSASAAAARPGSARAANWEGGGGGGGMVDVHPDAMAVHNLVMKRKPLERGLLIQHARVAGRPDWLKDRQQQMVPVRDDHGRPMKVMFAPARRHGYCAVQPLIARESIILAQLTYSTWYGAMLAVWKALLDIPLQDHLVSSFDAPLDPWVGSWLDIAQKA